MKPMLAIMRCAVVALAAAGTMGGCAQDPARAQQEQAALDAQDQARCRDSGYQPGTREFDQCLNYWADQRYQERARVSDSLRGIAPH